MKEGPIDKIACYNLFVCQQIVYVRLESAERCENKVNPLNPPVRIPGRFFKFLALRAVELHQTFIGRYWE